jgi:hypothetical protein
LLGVDFGQTYRARPGDLIGVTPQHFLGAPGGAMLDALVSGTTDPEILAGLARGRLRKKIHALGPLPTVPPGPCDALEPVGDKNLGSGP